MSVEGQRSTPRAQTCRRIIPLHRMSALVRHPRPQTCPARLCPVCRFGWHPGQIRHPARFALRARQNTSRGFAPSARLADRRQGRPQACGVRSRPLDAAHLPYNEALVVYLREQAAAGRPLILSTGADRQLADRVAAHLGIFNEVFSSDGDTNLTGVDKLRLLQRTFRFRRFCLRRQQPQRPSAVNSLRRRHAGEPDRRPRKLAEAQENSRAERFPRSGPACRLNLARSARSSMGQECTYIFAASPGPCHWSRRVGEVRPRISQLQPGRVRVPISSTIFSTWLPTAFTPPSAAGPSPRAIFPSSPAFAWPAFYLRPVFSSRFPWLPGLLPGCSLLLRHAGVFALLQARCHCRCHHSLRPLYPANPGGRGRGRVPISDWMAGFSIFFFFSLALVKRFSELENLRARGVAPSNGRGYLVHDMEQLRAFGTASAFASIVVFTLYINNPDVRRLYHHPQRLWLL